MISTAILRTAGLLCGVFLLSGEEPVVSGIFTDVQARAGRVAYENTCGQCHTDSLLGRKGDGAERPPLNALPSAYQQFIGPRGYVRPLAGREFVERWGSKTAAELIVRFEETVVQFPPEGMDGETSVNITAYVLQVNGAKAGMKPLTRNTQSVVWRVIGGAESAAKAKR